jgi:hypothetical protein
MKKSSDNLPRNILDLERKKCRLVKGMMTEQCTWRQHLNIMGISERATCRKCGQDKESSTQTASTLSVASHRTEFFPVWLVPIDNRRARIMRWFQF